MISGQVRNIEVDVNGNLKVETEYTLTDGAKKIGHTRYSCIGFSREKVEADVKKHCETLMKKVYNLKQNLVLANTKVDDISHECTSVELIIKPELKDAEGIITQVEEKIIVDDSDPS